MLAVRIVKKPPIVRSGECGWSEGRLKQCRNGSPAVGMLAVRIVKKPPIVRSGECG
jgi:hypothetical protein